LARQELNVQRDADRFDRDSKRDYEKALRHVWKETRALMTDAERMMSRKEWMAYCESKSNMLQEYYLKQQRGKSVVRALVVGRMGIYNCDRIIKLKNTQEVKPRFVLADGKAVDWKAAYLFDEKFNGVITFEHYNENSTVTLSPKKLKMIIVADKDGRTYRLNESEVIAMNRSQKAQRIMHVTEFEQTVSSLDEMREMLGLAEE
ncbi:MAG: hypothetical protein ACPGD8_08205, partial [Flavobacteriales bacterium]